MIAADGVVKSTDAGMLACSAERTTDNAACEEDAE